MNEPFEQEPLASLEEDPIRRARVISELTSRCTLETLGQGAAARIAWYFLHMEEYFERWSSCLTILSMANMLHNDLYHLLLIAQDLIDNEIRELSSAEALTSEWHGLTSAIKSITPTTPKEISEILRSHFERFRRELDSCLGSTQVESRNED